MDTPKVEATSLDDMSFLDDLPESVDDYEIEKFDGQDDEGCEGGACKI